MYRQGSVDSRAPFSFGPIWWQFSHSLAPASICCAWPGLCSYLGGFAVLLCASKVLQFCEKDSHELTRLCN